MGDGVGFFVRGYVLSLIAAGLAILGGTSAYAQDSCQPQMKAETSAGALVSLRLSSACHAGSPFVLHHSGMMISEKVDDTGSFEINFPALNSTALFMAEFPDGAVAIVSSEVPSLSFYDRVAVQWTGGAGLELHAREFGAAYGSEGDVWSGAPRSMDYAALGEGGFLLSLGDPSVENAVLAEVYTFPSATTRQTGVVSMSVEVVIQDSNCGKSIDALSLKAEPEGNLSAREMTVELPDCSASGDILVLNQLVDDLKIGSQ